MSPHNVCNSTTRIVSGKLNFGTFLGGNNYIVCMGYTYQIIREISRCLCWKFPQKCFFFFTLKLLCLLSATALMRLQQASPRYALELERGGIRGMTHSRFLQDQRKRRIAVFHDASGCVFVMKASLAQTGSVRLCCLHALAKGVYSFLIKSITAR